MKKSALLLAVMAVVMMCIINVKSAQAQANPNHVYHVLTWYMIPGQDSLARAQRDAMLKEYFTKVTMKNEFVIHQWTMSHYFTDDSREFVIITEFAGWNDIDKSFDRDDELEKQAWPDAQKRQEFMKKMDSYFTYHKDAIFNGLPNLTK